MTARPPGGYSDGPSQQTAIAKGSLNRNDQENVRENSRSFLSEESFQRKKSSHPGIDNETYHPACGMSRRLHFHTGGHEKTRALPKNKSTRRIKHDRFRQRQSPISLADRFVPDRGDGFDRSSLQSSASRPFKSDNTTPIGTTKNSAERPSLSGIVGHEKYASPDTPKGASKESIIERVSCKPVSPVENLNTSEKQPISAKAWKEDRPLDKFFFQSLLNGERNMDEKNTPVEHELKTPNAQPPNLKLAMPRESDAEYQNVTASQSSLSSAFDNPELTPTSVTSAMSISSGSMPSSRSSLQPNKRPKWKCIMCKRPGTPLIDELVQCSCCRVYYHTSCHNPKIISRQDNSAPWKCHRCPVNSVKSDASSSASWKVPITPKPALLGVRSDSSSEESIKETYNQPLRPFRQENKQWQLKSNTRNDTDSEGPIKKRRTLPWATTASTRSSPGAMLQRHRKKKTNLVSSRKAAGITAEDIKSKHTSGFPPTIGDVQAPATGKISQKASFAWQSSRRRLPDAWALKAYAGSQPTLSDSDEIELAASPKRVASPFLRDEVTNGREDEVEQSLSEAPMSIDSIESTGTASPPTVTPITQDPIHTRTSSPAPLFGHPSRVLPSKTPLRREEAPSEVSSPPYSPPPAEPPDNHLRTLPPAMASRTPYGAALIPIDAEATGYPCSSCDNYVISRAEGDYARRLCDKCVRKSDSGNKGDTHQQTHRSIGRSPSRPPNEDIVHGNPYFQSRGAGPSRSQPIFSSQFNSTPSTSRTPSFGHTKESFRYRTPSISRDDNNHNNGPSAIRKGSEENTERIDRPKTRSEMVEERINLNLFRPADDMTGLVKASEAPALVEASSAFTAPRNGATCGLVRTPSIPTPRMGRKQSPTRVVAARKDNVIQRGSSSTPQEHRISGPAKSAVPLSRQNSISGSARKAVVQKSRPTLKHALKVKSTTHLANDFDDATSIESDLGEGEMEDDEADEEVELEISENDNTIKLLEEKLKAQEKKLEEQKRSTVNYVHRCNQLEKELQDERRQNENLNKTLDATRAAASLPAVTPSLSVSSVQPGESRKSVSLRELYKNLDFTAESPFDDIVAQETSAIASQPLERIRPKSRFNPFWNSLPDLVSGRVHVHRQVVRSRGPLQGQSVKIVEDPRTEKNNGNSGTDSCENSVFPPPLAPKGKSMTFEQFMGIRGDVIPYKDAEDSRLCFKTVVLNERNKRLNRSVRCDHYRLRYPGDLKSNLI